MCVVQCHGASEFSLVNRPDCLIAVRKEECRVSKPARRRKMDQVEKRIIELIDKHKDEIIEFARDIYAHAELGYKEYRTSQKFTDILKTLPVSRIDTGFAITGVKGYLKKPEEENGPAVALIGELDALRIPRHPFANPETEGAHCCGHHAQLAGVIGAAIALSDPEISQAMDGNIIFFGVPAEEFGEVEFKNSLISQGKIVYGGGKCELIRIGAFDDIDMSVVHHTNSGNISVGNGTSNGFISKLIRYKGEPAHAAGEPHKGINALNAASLGLTALQFQRETFRDEDSVRVHPILTKGGDLVNVIPDDVVIETLVRAKTNEAIKDADQKTDRAFKAGAFAVGAGYTIETKCGYLPQLARPAPQALIDAALLSAPGREIEIVDVESHGAASTDVGDLQHIQPVLTFQTSGVSGPFHSDRFTITDEDEAYITTAKIFALTAYELLKNKAKAANEIIRTFEPQFTKETYIEYMNSIARVETSE